MRSAFHSLPGGLLTSVRWAQCPAWLLLLICHMNLAAAADRPLPAVVANDQGLVYNAAANGDRLPDFSYCGYAAGAESIPWVETQLQLAPSGADDTQLIQAAIDHLVHANKETSGWRGAIQLQPGQFHVSGSLRLHGQRIVLRGTGANATTIIATGQSRRPLIVIGGRDSPQASAKSDSAKLDSASDVSEYAPVGSLSLQVEDADKWSPGQRIRIEHPSTSEWIRAVGMQGFPNDDGRGSWLDWKPGTVDQVWERTITAIEGSTLHLDAPLTSSLDPLLANSLVVASSPTPRAHHVGVEHLTLVSQVDTSVNPKDEEHSWNAIQVDKAEDIWVRSVVCRQFAGAAVQLGREAFRITVADCQSLDPVSEDAGWRRHSFHTLGQQTLFLRCRSHSGRHDFSVGPLTPGPNAFVYCSTQDSKGFSGPIGSWCSGVLYDNVEIDGGGLSLTNLETAAQGTGWAAANCVLWNCVAPIVTCRKPPTANNWAIGVWGEFVGDGTWETLNGFTTPDSLYAFQLQARLGAEQSELVMRPAEVPKGSEATVFEPHIASPRSELEEGSPQQLQLRKGVLMIGDRLAAGKRLSPSWWRGSVLPAKVAEFGPAITRFVPGRDERFYTDEISDVVQQMKSGGYIALEHHWGLWYDRRRDDHQMVRRIQGDAWPPFYEQPWARSGVGTAWDGLSRYDLTRFNTWYFDRLSQFAQQADANGLILMQYMYFQHNILEAGAHWADFPWRPANCIQETGFPEPPIYENRKRVFMAEDFYDITHPLRRDLHERYIRHCLDTLGKYSNVMFVLGDEFTGPTHFVRFWLDTLRQWQMDTGRDVMIVLSTTRDVQTEILADPNYASLIDVIDIKYWWYTKDGSLYNPAGGRNLAPRQQLREWPGSKSASAESLSRSIAEMKSRFPEKAVMCSVPGSDPTAVLSAGGSLPVLAK